MRSIRLRLFFLLILGFFILANGQADIIDAIEIETGIESSDAISAADEVDWFRFNLPADGNVIVSLRHEQFSDSNAVHWNVYLYSGTNLESSLDSMSIKATARRGSFSVGIGAGTYFLKVTPQYNKYDTTWWDDPYFLTVNFEESNYYEKSPNHNPNWATPIDLNREYSANLAFRTDVDYFILNFPAEGKVNLTFRHQELTTSNSIYWNVHLYEQADLETPHQSVAIKGSQLSVSSDEFTLTAGIYVIKVTPLYDKYGNTEKWWNDQYFLKVQTDVEAVCAQVTTYAKNPISGNWITFPTSCDVPEGWATQTTQPDSLTSTESCETIVDQQACIDNPAACNLYTQADLEAASHSGKMAGQQECFNNPAACGILVNGEHTNQALTLTGGGFYQVGHKLIVTLRENIEVSNRFKRVDLWVVIKLPKEGGLLYMTNDPFNEFVTEPTPFKRSIERSDVIHQILEFEVIPNMGGDYIIYAFYNKEGTGLENLFQTLRYNFSYLTITLSDE